MKIHSHFFTDLAAGLLLFGGSLILAQTTTTVKKSPATTASASSAIAERQDQFGHAAGKRGVESASPASIGEASAADAMYLDSAHATDAVQQKHENRVSAATGTASAGTSNEIGIDERGFPNKPVASLNGISSNKPVAESHQ
jgi:hypothetical protein